MRPNILFILVDGLRHDQCFGVDKTSHTPFLDYLISSGVYFKNTFSFLEFLIFLCSILREYAFDVKILSICLTPH